MDLAVIRPPVPPAAVTMHLMPTAGTTLQAGFLVSYSSPLLLSYESTGDAGTMASLPP